MLLPERAGRGSADLDSAIVAAAVVDLSAASFSRRSFLNRAILSRSASITAESDNNALGWTSADRRLAERLAGLEPMQSLEQHEPALIWSNENRDLLSNFQDTRGDLFDDLGPEGFPFLQGNVDLVDWKVFRAGHGVIPSSGAVHKTKFNDEALRRGRSLVNRAGLKRSAYMA